MDNEAGRSKIAEEKRSELLKMFHLQREEMKKIFQRNR